MSIKLVVQHQYEVSVKKSILTTHKIKKKKKKGRFWPTDFQSGGKKKHPKTKQSRGTKQKATLESLILLF